MHLVCIANEAKHKRTSVHEQTRTRKRPTNKNQNKSFKYQYFWKLLALLSTTLKELSIYIHDSVQFKNLTEVQ